MADMAGRRNKVSTGSSRKYIKNGVSVTHKLNGPGAALIDNLGSRFSSPSRFVWRGAMSQLPKVTSDVLVILEKVSARINKNLVVK